ncbi:MAG: LarC family nickel insertion protein [Desulfitobacteriaceae bacterium]|nr:LarC family nickel insertion protein [Desulfitobacteriaceae bacterium]MDD4346481.1 LarC family nickel insertion protein [Desulfitobacteriaceae bacterium]
MRALYWDAFAGVSGDMALASLIALGADPEIIIGQLQSLGLNEFSLKITSPQIQGIQATDVNVILLNADKHHRNLEDIEKMIENGEIPERAKINSLLVFRKLAEAEAKVHGITVDKVHFHEVGAVDSIVDIVGTCLAIEQLAINEINVSLLPWSRGFIKCAHGILPVPAPATLELLSGFEFYDSGVIGELITPTGAAILSTITKQTPFPKMNLLKVGYGAGKNNYGLPNLLRSILGQTL